MNRLLIILALAATACGATEDPAIGKTGMERLLAMGPDLAGSADTRREALEASLVDPSNGYSQLRLAKYGLGGQGWDALPVRNFEVRPLVDGDIGAFKGAAYRASGGHFERVFDPQTFEWTHESLMELGELAFHQYPLELATRFIAATESETAVEETGLWRHDGRVGGLVRVRLKDGSEGFASTCSTCHASVVDGELIDGRANAAVDHSAMSRLYLGLRGTDWGPGRVDVTSDDLDNPVAIADLRPIRHQQRLHWAATLYNNPEALAVRVETLMITSANQAMRPPREVSIALAYYLWSLGEPESTPAAPGGAAVFDRECTGCHAADGSVGAPVTIESIGTDPAVGLSSMRGTGEYRIPSLHNVASRSQFLHEGKVKSLEQMFSSERLEDVPGHEYGTNLSDDDHEALMAFLASL